MAAEQPRATPQRVVRLLALHARLDLLWAVRSLGQATAYFVSDLLIAVGAATGTFLLAERFDGIGAWPKSRVIFMLGFALAARGALDLFFGQNVAVISRRLGRGQLDHSLIQPQPIWLSFLTEGFSPVSGSATFLIGAVVLAWATREAGVPVTPAWLLLLLVNLAAATAIMMAFSFLWGSLAFWTPRGAEEINSRTLSIMNGLSVFPLDGLGPAVQTGLLTLVPAGFIAWLPARALTEPGGPLLGVLWTPMAAVGFWLLALYVFRKGLVRYGHTGSVRYIDAGHRR